MSKPKKEKAKDVNTILYELFSDPELSPATARAEMERIENSLTGENIMCFMGALRRNPCLPTMFLEDAGFKAYLEDYEERMARKKP